MAYVNQFTLHTIRNENWAVNDQYRLHPVQAWELL